MDNSTFNSIISIITLFTAIVTAIISWFTLQSQKKTQENTRLLVGSIEALNRYLELNLFSLLKIEMFIAICGNIMEKTDYKAKLSGSLFAGLKFDLSPYNNNLFYSNESLYSDLTSYKCALINMNDLCDAFFEEQNNTNMTKDKLNCYFSSFLANLRNAYDGWYNLSLYYTPVTMKIKPNKISEDVVRNEVKKVVENKIFFLFDDYLKHMPDSVVKDIKDLKVKFDTSKCLLLPYFKDEESKQKVIEFLNTFFVAHYSTLKDFYYIEEPQTNLCQSVSAENRLS